MSCDLISLVESKVNMECNNDEASKAVAIAYEKIAEKDYNEARTFASKANDLNPLQKDHKAPCPPPERHSVKSSTFWACCECCKLLRQYPMKNLNKRIRCVGCCNFFYAWADRQLDIPSNVSNTASSSTHVNGRKSSMQNTTNKSSHADGVGTGNVQATLASSSAQPSPGFWENYAGFMREAATREIALDKTHAANETDSGLAAQASVAATGSVVKTNKQKRTRVSKIDKENLGTNSEIKDFLKTISKRHIQKNVTKWRIAQIPKNEEVKKDMRSNHIVLAVSARNLVKDTVTITVPDGDFHDFDNDRTGISFAENEVWAVYDCDDGMPRLYAMIRKVISVAPFKLKISWLKSKSTAEFGSAHWINAGFIKTIGDLRASKSEMNTSLNSFSHKVRWAKAARGHIQIYPKKGDVWALYKNWSCDWSGLTPVEVIRKYEMVEVVEDYSKEKGATVVELVKVAGFKTVFCQILGPNRTRIIPRKEMFRFSHQVPSYLLKGHEGDNVPKNCLELDPASMPMELLQVLTKAQVDKTEINAAVLGVADEKHETEAEKLNGQGTETKGFHVYKRRRLGTKPVEARSSATSNEEL